MLSKPTILVLTDFKPSSDNALKSAKSIGLKVSGKIHTVHVSDIPVQWDWLAEGAGALLMSERVIAEHLSSLNKLMAEQKKRCEINCTSEVIIGTVFEGIESAITKLKPDLVVMGHQGHHPHLLNLGSTVSKVVSSSRVATLVVRRVLASPLGRVAGLVDDTKVMTEILNATEEFSFLLSADVEIISLWRKPYVRDITLEDDELISHWIREEITKNLDKHTKCKVRVEETEERQVAYHLARILEQDHVELAIMKRHQKSALEKMFIGSETRRLLEICDGNILVLPP